MNDDLKIYGVEIHDDAVQMLNKHIRFLTNVSIPSARKLRTALYDASKSLEANPQRCPIYQTHRTSDTYRQLIVGRYLIIFSVNEKKSIVNIKYIFDSRQDNDI